MCVYAIYLFILNVMVCEIFMHWDDETVLHPEQWLNQQQHHSEALRRISLDVPSARESGPLIGERTSAYTLSKNFLISFFATFEKLTE